MKRNLLLALQSNTSPTSAGEFNRFLMLRHGMTSRENVSNDVSLLEAEEREFIARQSRQRKLQDQKAPSK